jgi:thiol-disulfide isomerase/thioredoxin
MLARRLLSFFIGLALLATGCGGKALGSQPSGQTIRAATGYNVVRFEGARRIKPRAFRGVDLDQKSISSSLLDGKVSVVNFWASWCGPCRAEQAQLEAIWKQYAPRGVQFLGVNIRDTVANAHAHVEEFGVTYPSVFNPDSTVAYGFRVAFIPTTVVLDSRGRVAARIIGATTEASGLTAILDQTMGS